MHCKMALINMLSRSGFWDSLSGSLIGGLVILIIGLHYANRDKISSKLEKALDLLYEEMENVVDVYGRYKQVGFSRMGGVGITGQKVNIVRKLISIYAPELTPLSDKVNEEVKAVSQKMQGNDFDITPLALSIDNLGKELVRMIKERA